MLSKENILDFAVLKDMADNEPVSGLFLIKDYSRKSAKNGSYYMDGIVQCKEPLSFKAWGSSDAFDTLSSENLAGKVVYGVCKVNLYGGVVSLILDAVTVADLTGTGITSGDFFTAKYDGDKYFAAIENLLLKGVDKNTLGIYHMLIDGVKDRFLTEFAAKSFHDNCRGGLVAHTYKVMYMARLLKFYPEILRIEGDLNLLYLGMAIHDIGKVMEYTDGAITGIGKIVSHHTFGVEMLMSKKSEIVSVKGEDFFYRLCAIVEQHHGEYEETPRTVEAYIIHLMDKLESSLQLLDQKLEGLNRGDQIQIDTMKLV